MLLAKDLRLGRVHLLDIFLETLQQRAAYRHLLRARRQQVDDLVKLAAIKDQQMAARQQLRDLKQRGISIDEW